MSRAAISSTTDLGERFARSVAAHDADALKALLAPTVNFRALTPGRHWESDDANEVVDDMILGTWFSPERSITRILEVERSTVGSVERCRLPIPGEASRRRLHHRAAGVPQDRERQDLVAADSVLGVRP